MYIIIIIFQRCFKEVVETDNGTAEYNWGCASPQVNTFFNPYPAGTESH